MLRISKLTDYAILIMVELARDGSMMSAHTLADCVHVELPTASKVLKMLAGAGLVVSHRGANGGYTLAHRPADIRITEVIIAVDGPIALTSCLDAEGTDCSLLDTCPTRTNWQTINDAIRRALDEVSLADMMGPMAAFIPPFERRNIRETGA